MFSIQKLIVFAIIIAALWLGFRLISNMDKRRKLEEREMRPSWRERMFSRRSEKVATGRRPVKGEVDMVACPRCGDYVAASGARACGKAECPYASAA